MERNIATALKVLNSVSMRHPELQLEKQVSEMQDDDFAKAWVQAVVDASKEEKRRAKETGVFRIRWGDTPSKEYLYRLEDYKEVADYIEAHGDFPTELALEDPDSFLKG